MAKKDNQPKQTEDENFNYIVRIANSDIDGQKRTVIGLQSIKGVGKRVAEIIAKKALDAGITEIVFDRGGNLYHGRVKAVAEAAREAGLKF